MTHLTEDSVLDLVHGLLPPDRRDQVAEHLKSCPACEELLRRRAAERERLRASGAPEALSADVAGVRAEAEKRRRAKTRAPRHEARPWPTWARIWAPAATVAAIGVVALLFVQGRRGANPPLIEPRWLPTGVEIIEQRSADLAPGNRPDELVLGLEAYEKRDMDRAIAHLEATQEEDLRFEALRRAYLGSALLAKGDYDQASRILRSTDPGLAPEPWRTETLWGLYVALRRSGQTASADSLEKRFLREPGELGARARGARMRR